MWKKTEASYRQVLSGKPLDVHQRYTTSTSNTLGILPQDQGHLVDALAMNQSVMPRDGKRWVQTTAIRLTQPMSLRASTKARKGWLRQRYVPAGAEGLSEVPL